MRKLASLMVVAAIGLAPVLASAQLQMSRTLLEPTYEKVPTESVPMPPETTPHATGVERVAYSSASEIFYFWLDGITVDPGQSDCEDPDRLDRFAIRDEPQNEELIAQIKMAFLSGKQLNATWDRGTCAGGAVAPHYIKLYR